MKRQPDPFATPERTAIRDDPFARAAQAAGHAPHARAEPTDTLLGPLARRDPDAAPETTGVLVGEGAASIDEVLRRARWSGFVAGLVAGALAATAVARLVAWWTSTPPAP